MTWPVATSSAANSVVVPLRCPRHCPCGIQVPAPVRPDWRMTDGRLPLLETEVGRVLAIAAHPDDLEYGASAAVASWTWAGHDVVYLLVTRGEAGVDGLDPAEAGPLRERERRASARVGGVRQMEFLDYADGVVESGPRLRRPRRGDPLTPARHVAAGESPGCVGARNAEHGGSPGGRCGGVGRNGRRGQSLALPRPRRRPPAGSAFAAAGGRRELAAVQPVIPVDAAAVDAAVASLAEHRAYLEALGDHPMADPEILRMWLQGGGERAGVDAGVAVEVFCDV